MKVRDFRFIVLLHFLISFVFRFLVNFISGILLKHCAVCAELVGDVLRARPKETDGIENVVVVDGLPVVGEDRLDKLKGVIRKIFGKFGNINTESYASTLAEGQTTS